MTCHKNPSPSNHAVDEHIFDNVCHDCMAAANASVGVRCDHWKITVARAE